MSGEYVIRIEGAAAAEEKLAKLIEPGIRKAMLKAIRPGAVIMRDAIKAEAHFAGVSRTDPGGLTRSIKVRPIRKRYGIGYMAGPMGKGSPHRHLVERGHDVKRTKNGPVLGRTKANPFVERGREASEAMATIAMERGLAQAIGEEV